MNKKTLFLALMLILALAISAVAQDEEEEEEKWRNFEIALSGGLAIPSGTFSDWGDTLGAKTGFEIGLGGGLYFTNNICFGAYFDYAQFGASDYDLNYRFYNTGLYGKYCFSGESNLEPYFKVSGGFAFPKFATWVGDDSNVLRELSYDPIVNFGFYVGTLYYTSDYGSLSLELGYHMAMAKDATAEYASVEYLLEDNINYLEIRAGVTVFFGPE